MSNIIKLLPDSVANQIAAGEVIQRPASAAKELLENAIDAGSTNITLVVKDAGKTLIQVTDNGSGMSDIDARMAFERHATSKITNADDLFAIKTMGFRGEALASIAAISHVELKSKEKDIEIGTCLKIEGSTVINQDPCQCGTGTSIMIKNLFFNVPARRNFLKSNNVELRHINEEFIRVSMINPDIAFSYYNNDKLVYKLMPGSLKSRIAALMGNVYNERLLPVDQNTDMVKISGFIGKPEFAKKTRGEQYFFVNGRYIKHPYLNHAVLNAYTELIPVDSFPSYFIVIDIDPKDIDVNIHPTKTEVNFQDARYVYAVLHAAIKQSIGKHSLTPTIDFDVNPNVEAAFEVVPTGDVKQPTIQVDPDFNPFNKSHVDSGGFVPNYKKADTENWESLYKDPVKSSADDTQLPDFHNKQHDPDEGYVKNKFMQVHNRFMICSVKSGMMVIDQNLAHYRIKYEEILERLKGTSQDSQQVLFPERLHLSPADTQIIQSITDDLKKTGFILKEVGSNEFEITGVPSDIQHVNAVNVIESIIENYKLNKTDIDFDSKISLARSIAVKSAIKSGTKLDEREMQDIFDNLFMCTVPKVSPDGKKILTIISIDELEKLINKVD